MNPMEVTVAILAGGEGSRMGAAKGAMRVRGTPILEFLLDRWKWTGPTMLVTAPGRELPAGWEKFSCEVSDAVAGEGPLRGIETAMRTCATPALIVATCDMPLITAVQFEWLIDSLSARPASLGVMCRRNGAIEPFPSIFRTAALPIIAERLAAKRRSVHALAEDAQFAVLDTSAWDVQVFTNLNYPGDLERFDSM